MSKRPPDRPPKPVPRGDRIPAHANRALYLYTVHDTRYPADQFNPTISRAARGGRFGPIRKDPYAYIYVGEKPAAALAEVFLRNGPRKAAWSRSIPLSDLEGRSFSRLSIKDAFEIVGICDYNRLADWNADPWLVEAAEEDYPLTRKWPPHFRDANPNAVGIAWRSKRVNEWMGSASQPRVLVLFEDRCQALTVDLRMDFTYECTSSKGLGIIQKGLQQIGVTIDKST